jgi:SAM-dependent methyltransferase
MRLYDELASWWPLLSAPADYAEEADSFRSMLASVESPPALPAGRRPALLELGSGGGNLASHLAPYFDLTLSDIAPGMLAVSRTLNPGAEHVEGDMRTLRLGRTFDAVLIHDAIAYMTTPQELREALETAAVHCRPGGMVVVAPDFVREIFAAGTSHGGEDGDDGRGLRYLEWMYDPDPTDDTVEVLYTVVTRLADGSAQVHLDRHVEGCFSRETWLDTFAAVGLEARIQVDAWDREVFVARHRAGR